MADEDRQGARKIVEGIMRSHGGITASDRAKTPASVLESLDGARENLAKATTILSNQLYSKDTRFVYELIQNAEDNTYKHAEANGQCPSLIFIVAPDQIIVDSNEDGFTENNVRAICKLGGSTKNANRGFIGEKGIGFKSVFKIASRVRVQSGPFCFAFEHGDDDHGLGMVTPINDTSEDLPQTVRTRFILTLNKHSSFKERIAEFEKLPDTLLLFLTKLKKIAICISKDAGMSETIYEYSYDKNLRLGTLRKRRSSSKGSNERSRQYYMERRSFKDLPKDKARPYTNEAEVVLAFPVDEHSIPVIEQQYVFAYLPMRRVGFHFQIQSDFITQASREDLLDSPRNRELRNKIAVTFRQAALRFRHEHSFEFTWLRYLPGQNISDVFWAELRQMILERLRAENLLMSWDGEWLLQGKDLRMVPADCLDTNDEPLFESLSHPSYLSPKYSTKDKELLMALGVQTLSDSEFCDTVSLDLEDPTSRWKSDSNNDHWHTRTAKKLLEITKSDISLVQDLDCIPLQDGSWTSGAEGVIYFPEYRAVPVPSDLGLRLVRKEALTNTAKKALFSALGVKACFPKIATPRILKVYNKSVVELQSSVSHLRWLYHFLPKEERGLDRRIPIFASDGVPTYRVRVTLGIDLRVRDLYFETEEDFGVKKLCNKRWSVRGIRKEIHHDVYFINEEYLNAVAPAINVNGVSWLDWLENSAGVRRVPRLVSPVKPSELSALFSWVVAHRPSQIVGTLQAHWSSYKDQMKPEIVSILRRAKVVGKAADRSALEATWLPTEEILIICNEFEIVDKMPLLKLPVKLDSKNLDDWKFVVQFGVGFEADTTFFLKILYIIKHSSDSSPESIPRHLLRIYEAIGKNCNPSSYDRVSEFFADGDFIYLPSSGSQTSEWTNEKDCLWKAPSFIDYRNILGSRDEYRNNRSIKHLFTTVLDIPNINCQHYVEQLQEWKENGGAVDNIVEVYRHISRSNAGVDEVEELRESFESNELIYVAGQEQWCSPSSCIWVESTRITGKIAIASEFPQQEDFFIGTLQVQEANKSTYIMELVTLCHVSSDPSISQVKTLLEEINSWDPCESDLDDLKPLSILPIKEPQGELMLLNLEDHFVLFDRQSHADIFQGNVPHLDFDMQKLHLLRPIISALGLDTRYTSRLMKEKTSAQHARKEMTLTRDLQLRAYAIVRCAVYYQDSSAISNADSLYQRLQRAEVYLSEDISTTINLVLDGDIIASQSTDGALHLQDNHDGIRLYVPRDERSRELSYLTQIPERIVSHLKITDRGAAKVFGDVLKSSLNVLDDVLMNHGIVHVPGIMAETMPGDLTPPFASSSASSFINDGLQDASSPTTSVTEASNVRAQSARFARMRDASGARDPAQNQVSQTMAIPSNDKYRTLLDHVIKSIRGSQPDLSYPDEPFVPDEVFGVRTINPVLHDMKIGAAGELFAFEFLRDCVPTVSRANWKSNIRKFVSVHEDYSDMASYEGPETADIVYKDFDGAMTQYFIDKEFLDEEIWEDETPKYFFEVKTTTQASKTRFFMSNAQKKRAERFVTLLTFARAQLKRMAIPPGESATEVYIIMRVFNLGRDDINVDFFVDPETLRREGELKFEAESWTVSQT